MNDAYKHLDAKLRIGDLTLGQWIGVIVGAGAGLLWGLYVSPFGQMLTVVTAIYLAAVPVGAAVSSNFTDFDPWLILRSAISWRRRDGLFVPGPGRAARGYVVNGDTHSDTSRSWEASQPPLELSSLWEAL